ncbi:WhiB family transcriptional regulator [Allonocardiopsis opalescens]|nr:WhiB family transcriptional regulator [Allonocardiopsis opalescens]
MPVVLAPLSRWDGRGAACAGEDTELFFAPDGERQPVRAIREKKAKEVCGRCPVRAECLASELWRRPGLQHGIFGGLTAEERVALRKQLMRRDGQGVFVAVRDAA